MHVPLFHSEHRPKYLSVLLFYSMIVLIIHMADGIMSYLAPYFIENKVENSFTMGLIIASSSVVGIICDALIPNVFRAKQHTFFLWNTISAALFFPVIFLMFPHTVPFFILAMAIWGIYYELIVFAESFFIEACIPPRHHALACGFLSSFKAFSYFIVPIFIPYLIDKGDTYPLFVAMILLFLALSGTFAFRVFFPNRKDHHPAPPEVVTKKTHFFKELKIWYVLLEKMWPVYLFILGILVVESAFLTIGVLASEELRQGSFWGSFLIPAFIFPSLLSGFVIEKITDRFGKKRTAFFSALVGGILLFMSSFATSVLWLVVIVFLSAIAMSAAQPAIWAAVQDYTSRLHSFGGDMIGLKNSAGSMSYIVGPIIAGWAGEQFGNIRAIGLLGLLLSAIALLNIVIVPRKIHMPQKALQSLD